MNTERVKCSATGKRRFATQGEAKSAIVAIHAYNSGSHRKRHKGKSTLSRVYRCAHCKGYHLTSMEYRSHRRYTKDKQSKEFRELVITPEQAQEWKKDSLPFPNKDL